MRLFRRNKKEESATETSSRPMETSSPIPNQAVELGTINYVNLTLDGRHGEYDKAVQVSRETGKPIFANFVEWSG